jgi:hypothetical protein
MGQVIAADRVAHAWRQIDRLKDSLESQFVQAQMRLAVDDISTLAALGISALDVGKDTVAPHKAGLYRREFGAVSAWILPVYSISGLLVDLIAMPHDRPAAIFWRLTGQGEALGYENIVRADERREPIMLHENPTEWLKAGRTGACILDWRKPWAAEVSNIEAIRVTRPEFGFEIERRLSQPFPYPNIQVKK